eukprot:7171333-Heterocapsa_arctica.AAC.1
MSGAPMKCQWSLRKMNTVGDGYGGEGCPYYVLGSWSWDALPRYTRDMQKGFSVAVYRSLMEMILER